MPLRGAYGEGKRDPLLQSALYNNGYLDGLFFRGVAPSPRAKGFVPGPAQPTRGMDTPDGRRVVSGSYDKTLKVWDLETGALICTFNCEGIVDCAAVATDGRTVVAGDAADRVYVLRLDNR